jgi:hypothetical protein
MNNDEKDLVIDQMTQALNIATDGELDKQLNE